MRNWCSTRSNGTARPPADPLVDGGRCCAAAAGDCSPLPPCAGSSMPTVPRADRARGERSHWVGRFGSPARCAGISAGSICARQRGWARSPMRRGSVPSRWRAGGASASGVAARPLLRPARADRPHRDRRPGAGPAAQRGRARSTGRCSCAGATGTTAATQAVRVRIAAAELAQRLCPLSATRTSGADWRVSELQFASQLPEDLAAMERYSATSTLSGQSGGRAAASRRRGFAVTTRATAVVAAAAAGSSLPAALWPMPRSAVALTAQLGGEPDVDGDTRSCRRPRCARCWQPQGSRRRRWRIPPRWAALQFSTALQFAQGAATLDPLSIALDDTNLTGKLSPAATRATGAALRSHRRPCGSGPLSGAGRCAELSRFELPLAGLKALDAKGVLRIAAGHASPAPPPGSDHRCRVSPRPRNSPAAAGLARPLRSARSALAAGSHRLSRVGVAR